MKEIISTIHQPEVQEMFVSWMSKRLNTFAEKMPEGKFLNRHNDKFETTDGIVILATGDVCPVFKNTVCALNPLRIHEDYVSLSTCSVAGNVIGLGSLTQTVEKYNQDLSEYIKRYELESFGRYAIVAYLSFGEW